MTQLKTEIISEVRKLMESFLVTYNQDNSPDNMMSLGLQLSKENLADAPAEIFSVLKEKFVKCCPSAGSLTRSEFSIAKRHLENPLGTGQFSIVYKAILNLGDGRFQQAAVKKIKWKGVHETIVESFLREVKAFSLIGVGHKNIVNFLGACCHTGMWRPYRLSSEIR